MAAALFCFAAILEERNSAHRDFISTAFGHLLNAQLALGASHLGQWQSCKARYSQVKCGNMCYIFV